MKQQLSHQHSSHLKPPSSDNPYKDSSNSNPNPQSEEEFNPLEPSATEQLDGNISDLEDNDEEDEDQGPTSFPIKPKKNRKGTYQSCSDSSSSYFESSSDPEDDSLAQAVKEINLDPLTQSHTQLPQIFKKDIDFDMIQKNKEGLVRKEFGGIIVYDSCARMIGNTQVQQYFENQNSNKLDHNILFTKEEINEVNQLFYQEARERDFQNEFDKFLYKHLPRFQSQRDFEHPNYTINVPQQENILIFDSQFENGNLRRAIKVNNVEYNLWLENDLNTKGHTQWYYFKVNYKYPKSKFYFIDHILGQKIQFNILNLMKPQSLYQQGMKPWIFSKRQNEESGRGWFNGGEEIKYYQNEIPRNKNSTTATYNKGNSTFLYNNNGAGEGVEFHFTLSFWYDFEYEEDELIFAHAIPYSYTDLQNNLKHLKEDEKCKEFCKINILCKTLGGNPCPLLTITENVDSYLDYYEEIKIQTKLNPVLKKSFKQKYQKAKKLYKQSQESKGKVRRLLKAAFEEEINQFYQNNEDALIQGDACFEGYNKKLISYIENHHNKKTIIITSRVHPGEPQSSQMLQGFIDYLVSDQAYQLRKNFVFRIVPMLNVDGVIYGNYRCSLLGVDLNRKWVQPNRYLHPTVFFAKQLIKYMHHERRVISYCDFHGHSRKQNAFFYGCSYKNFEHEGRIKNAQLRLIPLFCCHKNSLFSFKDCRFRIEKCKEQTARVVIFKEFNIMNSFTLEASFYGKDQNQLQLGSTQQLQKEETKENQSHEPKQLEPEEQKQTQGPIIANANSEALVKKKVKQLQIEDYQNIGKQLAMSYNNYLPEEQGKLDVLSGKILEIFYEEFIKFIPPYVLRREEEKKKQQNEQLQQQSSLNYAQNQGKRVSGNSPRQLGLLNVNSNSKKLKKPPIQKQVSIVDKTKIKKRKTINFNKKEQNFQQDDKGIDSVTPNYQTKPQNETDQENFSELININSNQEEILDLEMFIKKESALIKLNLERQKLREKGDQLIEEIEGEEDEYMDQTDSSDSEASAKEYFTKHQQEEDKQYYNIVKAKKSKQASKKASVKKKIKQIEPLKDPQIIQQPSFDLNPQNMMQSQDLQKLTETLQKPLQSLDDFKGEKLKQFIIVDKKEGYPDTVKSSTGTAKIFFEKITHRKASSPNHSSGEEKSASNLTNQMLSSQKSRNVVDQFLKFEEVKHGGILEQNSFFHSLDDSTVNLNLKRPVLPLYENAEYHCQRIQKYQGILGYGDKNFATQESQSKSPDRNFLQYMRPNTQHDFGQFKPRQMVVNDQIRKVKIKQNPYQNEVQLKQGFGGQSQYSSNGGHNQQMNSQSSSVRYPSSGLRTQNTEHQVNVSDMMYSQNQQMQRMSFKELLESSRQNREINHYQHTDQSLTQNPTSTNSQMLQMLQGTYQRFYQAYNSQEEESSLSPNVDRRPGRSLHLLKSQEKTICRSPIIVYKKSQGNHNKLSSQNSFNINPQPISQREQIVSNQNHFRQQQSFEPSQPMGGSNSLYQLPITNKQRSILYQHRLPTNQVISSPEKILNKSQLDTKNLSSLNKSDLQNYQKLKQIQMKISTQAQNLANLSIEQQSKVRVESSQAARARKFNTDKKQPLSNAPLTQTIRRQQHQSEDRRAATKIKQTK